VNAETRERSFWSYLGCGCGLLAALGLVAAVAFSWFIYRTGKEWQRGIADPRLRAERTRRLLPYDELPAGYHPVGGLSIPFFLDLAIFSDREPQPGHRERRLEGRGFVYVNARTWGGKREKLRRYFSGEGRNPEWLERADIEIADERPIGHGTVEVHGRQVAYTTRRARVVTAGASRRSITAMFIVPCPGDQRLRMGIWFAPDPRPDQPEAPADLAGTPADPAAIRDFAGHFRFCPGD